MNMKVRIPLLLVIGICSLGAHADQRPTPPKHDETKLKADFDAWVSSIDSVALVEAYPQAVKDLLSSDKPRQLTAIKLLGHTDDIRAIPWLLLTLDLKDPELRAWSGASLVADVSGVVHRIPAEKPARIRDLQPIAWLVLKMFRSPDDGNTRSHAARLAEILGFTAFDGELIECTQSIHPAVANSARAALKTMGIEAPSIQQDGGGARAAPVLKPTELLRRYMDDVRKDVVRDDGHCTARREDLPKILAGDPAEILPLLAAHEKDRMKEVRWEAYALAWQLGALSKDREVRRKCVDQLAAGLADEDASNWQWNASRLVGFNPAEFSPAAQAQVRTMLQDDNRATDAAVVAGAAGMNDLEPELSRLAALVDGHGKPTKTALYSRLALARLGNREAIEFCVTQARAKTSMVGKIRMIPMMMYIRQPEGTAFVRAVLESDERLPSLRDKGRDDGTPGNRYALDAMAHLLEGFPVPAKAGFGSYTDHDLQLARNWANQQPKFTFREWTGLYFTDVL